MTVTLDLSAILAGAPATATSVRTAFETLQSAFNGGVVIEPDINGGSIDGAIIGAASPAAITGTTVGATGDLNVGTAGLGGTAYFYGATTGGEGGQFTLIAADDYVGGSHIGAVVMDVYNDIGRLYPDGTPGPFNFEFDSKFAVRVLGTMEVAHTTVNALFTASANAGYQKGFELKTGSAIRWTFRTSTDAESGSEAGSDIVITRHNDAGAFLGSALRISRATGTVTTEAELEIDGALNHDGSTIGFYGTTPQSKPTVTGSRGGNAALASLCTQLAALGLITNSTS